MAGPVQGWASASHGARRRPGGRFGKGVHVPESAPNVMPAPPAKYPTPNEGIVLDILHCLIHIGDMKRAKTAGDPKMAVAYLRVSTQEQDLGPEAQRASIDGWAERHDVQIVSYFEDRVSGGTKVEERPAMLQAFGALRSAGAGLLVAAKRDRIARDVVVAATVEQMALEAGARVITADGVAVEDTPEGQLLRGMLDLFAQYERALIRARTRAALAVKRSKGERYTRRAPLGFHFQEGQLVEDPQERDTLARVREMKAPGLSTVRVVTILNAEGVRCRGGRWHVTTLARALRRAA
jgi:site-specific DNA recombinase